MTPKENQDEEITLRYHFESLLETFSKLQNERWRGHEEFHKQLAEALKLAVDALKQRLDEMNNFRTQINEERNTFLTKSWFENKYEELSNRVNKVESWRSNMDGRFWALGAALTGLVVLLQLVLKWLK